MPRPAFAERALPAAAILAPLAIYSFLRAFPALDLLVRVPVHHFVIVTGVSMLAGLLAAGVGLVGVRVRNLQVVFLALAFMSLTLIFFAHGLGTPGLLYGPGPLPGVAAQLSLLLTACWLGLSALPLDRGLAGGLARAHRLLVPGWAACLALLLAAMLRRPGHPWLVAVVNPPLSLAAAALTVALAMTTAHRYDRSRRFTRFPLQGALVYGSGWLAVAQPILSTVQTWRLSWWLYHLLLLLAVGSLLIGVARQYASGTSLALALRDLLAADPAQRVMPILPPSVRALGLATEARDRYTAGHNLRVSVAALRLAECMGLPPEQLRALALGGVVHDVGKIEVPDSILNKPGPLTPEERALVERHPVTGYEMGRQLGLMREELEVIRHHHERWDGTGYPDRLSGPQIPLLARILAVADVYDALTSARAYRPAWSHEQAVRHIAAQAGAQFDPEVVRAWLRLVGAPAPGDAAAGVALPEAAAAVEAGPGAAAAGDGPGGPEAGRRPTA